MARSLSGKTFVPSRPKTTKQGYGINSRPRKRGKKPLRGQGR